jgi:hypothetical protein
VNRRDCLQDQLRTFPRLASDLAGSNAIEVCVLVRLKYVLRKHPI